MCTCLSDCFCLSSVCVYSVCRIHILVYVCLLVWYISDKQGVGKTSCHWVQPVLMEMPSLKNLRSYMNNMILFISSCLKSGYYCFKSTVELEQNQPSLAISSGQIRTRQGDSVLAAFHQPLRLKLHVLRLLPLQLQLFANPVTPLY